MFSQNKGERDTGTLTRPDSGPRFEPKKASVNSDMVSALGRGMLVTGNILCAGSVQIFGRVIGDIHAANLTIGEGAYVEGNVTAQETTVQGVFKGTIHSNSVKLMSTAVVDGEILKQTLTIEPNAQFEGMSRRLERPVEAPTSEQVKGGRSADVVPISGSVG